MRCCRVLIVLLALIGAGPAAAGAWLREEGKGFGEISTTLGPYDPTGKIYVEYGWRPEVTLGFELETYGGADTGKATVFVVRPLGPTDRTWRASWLLGGGVAWSPLLNDPTVKGGVSVGRGLEWNGRYGWTAFDFTVEHFTYAQSTLTKLDSTIGMGMTERTRGMLQLFLTYLDDELTAKLAPSVLYQTRNERITLQVGIEIPDAGIRDTTLKIGLWKEF